MTIDEAIKQFKYDAECNRADLDLSYAEDNEQLAEWLEKLKIYQQHEIICNKGYNAGYNKAIDDFVHKVKEHQYVLSDVINSKDYGMFTIGIEQIAEQLKAGGKNEESI